MNWITKLERKFGRYCIPNLISILIGGQILVYAVELFVNQYISFYLNLDRGALLAGQIWRVITFMFVPFSGGGPLSVVLGIYFTWFIGTALEKEWGDFRFNLYLLLGMLGAVLACLCTGWADTYCLSLSLLPSFAMLLRIKSLPMLLVKMMIVFLKSTVRPCPSVILPSSSTWSRTFRTSGCAFSTSSNRSTA